MIISPQFLTSVMFTLSGAINPGGSVFQFSVKLDQRVNLHQVAAFTELSHHFDVIVITCNTGGSNLL